MTLGDRVFDTVTAVDDATAPRLGAAGSDAYTVAVRPPADASSVPATVPRFVKNVLELQSRYLFWNRSPVAAFEIRRPDPETVKLQFAVPTKRLERKVRTQLSESVPAVSFAEGVSGLPVSAGDTVGGGLLKLGQPDWYPVATDFNRPPTNNLIASLHRDAMQDTSVIIQILFQPVAGKPFRRWWWRRRAYKRIGQLRQEKQFVFHDRSATPRERKQADAIEAKVGNPQFRVAIRILLIGASEDVMRSRVKEIAGAFNVFESETTGQYLDTWTAKTVFPSRLIRFAEDVATRRFGAWSLPFRASHRELAGFVAVPTIDQQNLPTAQP